jgi:nucleotidyltransferase/DNA polymerase involved in DNA repair
MLQSNSGTIRTCAANLLLSHGRATGLLYAPLLMRQGSSVCARRCQRSGAERLCPEAIFVPPDFVRYKEASQAAQEIFHRHTDLIEPLSLDEAYLDVTENKTNLPTENPRGKDNPRANP